MVGWRHGSTVQGHRGRTGAGQEKVGRGRDKVDLGREKARATWGPGTSWSSAPGPETTDVRARHGRHQVVASYETYADAERAVDYLADHDFPVERTAIVGRGLHSVEKVTGRLGHAKAAGHPAAGGAVTGALIGWIFGLFNWINPLEAAVLLALYGALFGAIIGALVGLLMYGLTRGQRDFTSIAALQADRYDLIVDGDVAEGAMSMLTLGGLLRPVDALATATDPDPTRAADPTRPQGRRDR